MVFRREFHDAVMSHAGGSAGAGPGLDVNANVDNTAEQNAAYLHDYFFRSYTESHVLWSSVFAHPSYAAHVRRKGRIRLLSYGCGTGGDVAGLAGALAESGILDGGVLEICAVEGNADALGKCAGILDSLDRLRHPSMRHAFCPVVHRVERCDFVEDLPLGPEKFDIIETSKMINELLPDDFGAYFQFLRQIVGGFLADDGLALLADVPVTRMTRLQSDRGEDWLDPPAAQWAPKLMADAVRSFAGKSSGRWSVVLPAPCDGCAMKGCYSTAMYTYRLLSSDAPLVRSPLCCRLIAGRAMAELLGGAGEGGDACGGPYVTVRRKDGSTESCMRGGGRQNKKIRNIKALDGYRLQHGEE